MPFDKHGNWIGDEPTFAAASTAVRQSMVSATERYDAYARGEFPMSEAEALVAKELELGFHPGVAIKNVVVRLVRAGNRDMADTVRKITDAAMQRLFREARERQTERGVGPDNAKKFHAQRQDESGAGL
jgi:hypothetical protein